MALEHGDDAILDKYFPYQQHNRLKNHFRQSDPKTAVSNAQPGMILSDADDEKLWHKTEGSYVWDEILQEQSSYDARPRFYLVQVELEESTLSDPPTDAELDAVFTSPSALGAGSMVLIQDLGSGTEIYLVTSDGTNYWTNKFTKAT